jgi:hypothetical protein
MAATMTPKKLPSRYVKREKFDREAAHKRLFALPVPAPPSTDTLGPRRTYPIHTPLGRIMRLRRLHIRAVTRLDGCPSDRLMSDYLADRRAISPSHRQALGKALGVDPRIL